MNILFFHICGINPTGGGVSQITYVLANEFIKQGNNVSFLGHYTQAGVNYPENQYFLPNSEHLCCVENFDYIRTFCENHHIQVIINQNGLSQESVELVSKVKGVLKITVIHNSIFTQFRNFAAQYEYKLKSKHLGWLYLVIKGTPVRQFITWLYIRRYAKYYNRIADCSDAISVMSQGQVDDLKIVLNKNKWEKLYFIPNCINPYTLQWRPRSKTVLWVGTIDFRIKRVDIILKVWKQVQETHPDWSLKILGDSPYTAAAKSYALSLGVKNVSFEGRVAPEPYYLDAQIACVTSTHESFSMVLIESFKYGVVPMAFDSFPAATEIIHNGFDGIVVPAFDVESYAKELSSLMDDNERREKLRHNANETAQKYFSSNIYEEWKRILEKTPLLVD